MKNINLNVISDKSILSSIKIMNKYMNSFYKLMNVLFLLLLVFGSCVVSFGMDSGPVSGSVPLQINNKENKGKELEIQKQEIKIQKQEIKIQKQGLESQLKKLEVPDKVAELEAIKRNVVIQEIRDKLSANSMKGNQEDEKLKKANEDLQKQLNELECLNSAAQLEAEKKNKAIEDIQKQLLGIKIKELEISNEEKKLEIEKRKIEIEGVNKQLVVNAKKVNQTDPQVIKEKNDLEAKKVNLEDLNKAAELEIQKGSKEIEDIQTQLNKNIVEKPPILNLQIKNKKSKVENKPLVDPKNITAVKNMFEDVNALAKINEDIKKDYKDEDAKKKFIDIKKDDFNSITDAEIKEIIGDKDVSKLNEGGKADLLKDVCNFILMKRHSILMKRHSEGPLQEIKKIQSRFRVFSKRKKVKGFKEMALGAVGNLGSTDIEDMTKKQFNLEVEIEKLTFAEVGIITSKIPKDAKGDVVVKILCNFILDKIEKKKEEEEKKRKEREEEEEKQRQEEHKKCLKIWNGYLLPYDIQNEGGVVGKGGAKNSTISIEEQKDGDGIAVGHLQGPPYYNNIPNDKGDVNAYEYEDALSCVNDIQNRTNEFAQRLLCDGGVAVVKEDGGKVQYLRDMGNLKVDSTNEKEVKNLIYDNMKKGLPSTCGTMYSGLCGGAVQNRVFNYDGNVNPIQDNSLEVYKKMFAPEENKEDDREDEEKEKKDDNKIKEKEKKKDKEIEKKNEVKEYITRGEVVELLMNQRKVERLKSGVRNFIFKDFKNKVFQKSQGEGVFRNKILKLDKISNPRNDEEKYLAGEIPSINENVEKVNKSGEIRNYFKNSGTYNIAMDASSFNTKLEGLKYCMREADNSLGMIRLCAPYLKVKQQGVADKKSSKKASTIVKNPERVLKAKMFAEWVKLKKEEAEKKYKEYKKYKKLKKNGKEESKDNKKGDMVIVCGGNCKPEISSEKGGKIKFRIPGQQVISYEEENAAKEEGVSVKEIIDECADDISTEIHSLIENASRQEAVGYVLNDEVNIEDTRSEELKNAIEEGDDKELAESLKYVMDMHKQRVYTFVQAGKDALYSIEGVDGKKYPFPSDVNSELAALLRVNGIMGDSEFSLLERYFLSRYNKVHYMLDNPDISDYQKRNYGYRGLIYSSLGFVLSSVLSGVGGENNTWVNLSPGDVRVDVYRSNIFTSFGINVQIPLPMSLPLIGSNLNIHVIGVNFLSFILGGVILALLPLQKFEDEVNIMVNDSLNLLNSDLLGSKGTKKHYALQAKNIFENDSEEWLFKYYNKQKGYKGKLKHFFKWCFDRYYSDEREYLENNSFLFVLARRCLFDTLQLLSISIPVVDTYLSININFGTLLISWLIFGGKNKNNEDESVTNSGTTMGNSPNGPSFGSNNPNINNNLHTGPTSFLRMIPNGDEVDMNKLEQMKSMMENNNIQNFSNMGFKNMVPSVNIDDDINNNQSPVPEGMSEKN